MRDSGLDLFDPTTSVMDSPTAGCDPDFSFAFNDSNFSDRVLRIEIVADPAELASEYEARKILADWALRKRYSSTTTSWRRHDRHNATRRLLTSLVCEYLDWAQLNHTLKVYLPECNLPKDSWKSELKEFSSKNGYDLNQNGDGGPLLLDVLEGFLKYEKLSQGRSSNRRSTTPDAESLSNIEARRRPSSSTVAGGLPPLGRALPASQPSDRRAGSSTSVYRKEDYSWRYDNEELSEDVVRASAALENLQLDRKARNLTSSWRCIGLQNLTN